MLYLDTSLVVALITREARSAAAQDWLQEQAAGETAVSDWVIVEVSSALSIKQRTGDLHEVERSQAEQAFQRLSREVFDVLPVPRAAFAAAAGFAARQELSLRSGDALHLAISAHRDVRLCTLDARQAHAGRRLGLQTVLLFSNGAT